MDSGRKNRMNIERDTVVDRLSSLPDDLVHKILSFVGSKDTVKTSALSSRYRFIWTTMPYLSISTEDFPRSEKEVSKFVTEFLKRRRQIDVSSLKLRFHTEKQPLFVKELMDYAFSHNIQQLDVACLPEKHIEEFPLSLFSSQSLKYLSLKAESHQRYFFGTISTLELPALTTLYLQDVLCSHGIFSKCPSLKNLTLKSCQTEGWSSFSICHPGLSNLTLDAVEYVSLVNVVAPQLQNLIIRNTIISNNTIWPQEYVISAPNLASLAYKGDYPLLLSTDGLHCFKEADIFVCVPHPHDTTKTAHQMVCLLQQLYNVKFLKLNLEIIEEIIRCKHESLWPNYGCFYNKRKRIPRPKGKHPMESDNAKMRRKRKAQA